jgi:hypothetical protein
MFETDSVLRRRQSAIRAALHQSTVIVIDNVADYYFQHHTTSSGGMDGPAEFPQLAQPFPYAFYEYRLTPSMYDVMFTEADLGGRRVIDTVGIQVQSADAELCRRDLPALVGMMDEKRIGAPVQWVQFLTLFARNSVDRDVYGPCSQLMLAVGPDGLATSHLHIRAWGIADPCFELIDEDERFSIESIGRLAFPAFLAASLLHCRNVTTREHVPPPKLSKAFHRRHGHPLVRFRTLTIEPMKAVVRRDGQTKDSGLNQALHLCRGHFKDYRNSGGLFGKHQGLFWWDMHARGTLDQGAVVKDYAIKLPESGGSLEHR